MVWIRSALSTFPYRRPTSPQSHPSLMDRPWVGAAERRVAWQPSEACTPTTVHASQVLVPAMTLRHCTFSRGLFRPQLQLPLPALIPILAAIGCTGRERKSRRESNQSQEPPPHRLDSGGPGAGATKWPPRCSSVELCSPPSLEMGGSRRRWTAKGGDWACAASKLSAALRGKACYRRNNQKHTFKCARCIAHHQQ